MLIIKRKLGESFFIGENQEVKITYLGFTGNQLKLGIEAPKDFLILREELLDKNNSEVS
jgi:carbon storage regulator